MLYAPEKVWEGCLQSFGDPFYVHNRNIAHAPFDSAVVRPMEPAAVRSLLLVDPLFLANSSDRTAKTDSYVERH